MTLIIPRAESHTSVGGLNPSCAVLQHSLLALVSLDAKQVTGKRRRMECLRPCREWDRAQSVTALLCCSAEH